ncbi:MAG TPA: hypothetical protein VND64_17470 [Pirellulales bacterium]|nr:hypothetical protein [Pirellulales bacterium]
MSVVMGNSAITLIEKWFADHEDGNFAPPTPSEPFWVVRTTSNSARMIYTTKSTWIRAAFENSEFVDRAGLVFRCGLPVAADVPWLLDVVGRRELFFLGDLDPPDLMIFAWLRNRLAPAPIVHLGVNDWLLARIDAELPEHFQLRLAR